MKLHHTDDDDDEERGEPYDEAYYNPPRSRRVSRQIRETIIMCLLAGLIAALAWGIYKWTDASRYTPPIYSVGNKGDQ